MLSRKYRISLARLSQFGQKVSFNQIVLSIGIFPTEIPKFAIVVPAKCCRKAVARNRTRRLAWKAVSELVNRIKPAIYRIKICDDFSKLSQDQVLQRIQAVFSQAEKILIK